MEYILKKINIIILILLGFIFAQVDNVTDAEAAEAVEKVRVVVQGIQHGFWPWFKINWYVFLLAIVGVGQVIVRITPTKKDDKFFSKWILAPVNKIGRILSLGGKK